MAIQNQYQKVVPFFIFTLALIFFFRLVRPMITIVLSSFLLAYIVFPLHKRILKKVPYQPASIILSLIIITLILLIPVALLVFEVTQEGYLFYSSLSNKIEKGALFGYGCTSADSNVCALVNRFESFSVERLSAFGFDKQMQKFLPIVEEKITTFILSIPIMIAQIFLTLVISYFIIKDWKAILKKIVDLLPVKEKTINQLTKEFKTIANTVIYAQLFVALVQGIVGTIGFYIFGVPLPILLGIVMAFSALIPTIGTAIVWLPASVFMMFSGYYASGPWGLASGIGLFLYGLLIISTIDNILLAKIVNQRAKVSQIIVIVGVIGGASVFGVAGIFIGPILLPLLITYFETFKQRFV